MKHLLRRLHNALLNPFLRLPLSMALTLTALLLSWFGLIRLEIACFFLNDAIGWPLTRPHKRPILYALLATETCGFVVPTVPILYCMLALSVWLHWSSDEPPLDDREREKVRKEQLKWTPDLEAV